MENFSPLQQYILKECFNRRGGSVDRQAFASFYDNNIKVKKSLRAKIISKSLERLIERGALVGYGVRTTKKWFILRVKLTIVGQRKWLNFLSHRQRKLPIKY